MEEQLFNNYVGSKYDELETFKEKKYSVKCALTSLVVGPILLFYYRSYLLGFICLITQLIIGNIITAIIPSYNYTSVIFAIVYGYYMLPLYMWDVRRKVKSLINKNPNKSEFELMELAEKKGKNSILALILYLIIYLLMLAIVFLPIIASAIFA